VNAPRVRFAPSPTGYFHVGGARTALFNWLFAKRLGGVFVLRIEDTDRDRSDESWTAGILESLSWLGITWDEGPYFQSARRGLYDAATDQLFGDGHLYACDCTRDAIDARTKGAATPGYDGFCADRGLARGPGLALRFRVPDNGETVVHDIVRGDVVFSNELIEDFIVVKSNGDPLFVLANVVDDRDMEISHIVRAEEHLPTTPKAVLIWQALGGKELPVFAHVPVLVNEKRQKLSKRRDRVAVEDYRALGYLPEAMVNYLALLGWGPGDDREILTVDELVEEFRLEDVNLSPAFFDEKRLAHFNGLYIRALPVEEFVRRLTPFLQAGVAPWPADRLDMAVVAALAPLLQERIATLAEAAAMLEFLFADPFAPEEASVAKVITKDETALPILAEASARFAEIAWTHTALRNAVETISESLGQRLGKTQGPIRVATMGRSVGLPLFESLEVLGRTATLARLRDALSAI
jgi:glutamyl-tRNA synthetase